MTNGEQLLRDIGQVKTVSVPLVAITPPVWIDTMRCVFDLTSRLLCRT